MEAFCVHSRLPSPLRPLHGVRTIVHRIVFHPKLQFIVAGNGVFPGMTIVGCGVPRLARVPRLISA